MAEEKEYTSTQAAKKLGTDRTVLYRMESKGIIPKAKWRRKPQPHRVYTEAEIKVIEKIMAERSRVKAPDDAEFKD